MKKIFALMLALVMVLALAACGSTSQETAEAAPAAAEEAAPAAAVEEAAPAEDVAAEEPAAEEPAAEGQVFHIGICQLVEHVALDAASQGFMDALTELLGEGNVTFDYQTAQGESANCATIVNGFVADNVDLILANATAPLQSAAAATSDIPVLGTSITDYATALDIDGWTGTVGTNVSGTTDLAPLDGQADVLAELFPVESYPNVGLIYCSAEANSIYQVDTIQGFLEEKGYNVTQYSFSDSNDIASVVQTACDENEVLYVPTDNTAASNTEAIDNVAQPAGVPVVAGEEGICAGCGVATLSISYYDLGYRTGEMAYEILANGADVSTMAVESAPNFTKEYDAARCEALGVTIPEDYVAIAE